MSRVNSKWILVNQTAIKTSTIISIKYDQHIGMWEITTKQGAKYIFANDSCSASDWCWAVYQQAAVRQTGEGDETD